MNKSHTVTKDEVNMSYVRNIEKKEKAERRKSKCLVFGKSPSESKGFRFSLLKYPLRYTHERSTHERERD